MDQLLRDAKLLVQRLHHHDSAADSLIGDATNLESKLLAMREYREEVTKLNEIARHRPRSTLILGSQLENQRIQDLEHENRELHLSLTEHQSALELIMNKYREQVLNLLSHKGLDKAALEHLNKNSGDISVLTEKITEMAAVMQRAAKADEETQCVDAETVAKLKFENKALRELLHISGHPKKEIERLKVKSYLEREKMFINVSSDLSDTPSIDLDSSADEMESQTGTVKRKAKVVGGNDWNGDESKDVLINGSTSKGMVDESVELSRDAVNDSLCNMVEKSSSDERIVDEVVEVPCQIADTQTENSNTLEEMNEPEITVAKQLNSDFSEEVTYNEEKDQILVTQTTTDGLEESNNPAEEMVSSGVTSEVEKKNSEAMLNFELDKEALSDEAEKKEIGEDQLLELYNSEGRLLEGGEATFGMKSSPFEGRVSGMKIRKSSKQKKVIQANLKTFFEHESAAKDSSITSEISETIDCAASVSESGILGDFVPDLEPNLDDSKTETDQILRDKDSLSKLSSEKIHENDMLGQEIPTVDNELHGQNEDLAKNEKAVDDDLDPSLSMQDIASSCPTTIKDELSMEVDVASEVNDIDDKREKSSKEQKEDDQTDSVDSGRSSLSNGKDDAKKPTHRTVELDFSDSDSDEAEIMIEDQFADIIAEANESSSESGSDYSDHEPDFEELEPTEEELVGDLEEGGEFVISSWTRPKDELDHLGGSWIEHETKEESDSDVPDKPAGTENEVAPNSGVKEAGAKLADGSNDNSENSENFSFLHASYQIDQFTGGSIKAKYAKRKSYENAHKASAVTLSSNMASSESISSTDTSSNSDVIINTQNQGSMKEDAPSLAVNSTELISSSSDRSDSQNESPTSNSASESSSGEIDPLVFKRRLSVDPPRDDIKSDCAEHLTELLSDLDATLALSDENDGDEK